MKQGDRLSIATRIADGLTMTPDSDGFGIIARVAETFRSQTGRLSALGTPAAAAARRPETPIRPRFLWGPLEVHEQVGVGQFGEVYRAFDPRLQREVALKLRKVTTDGESSPREFLEEARQLARVRHENVLVIHGADVFADRVGIWTEFVHGKTLEEQQAARTEGYEVDEVCRIGAQIALALAAVHESGLLHGDVSARNVILEEGGRVLLADFGCAVDLDSDTSAWIGTPKYAAPELLLAGRPTEQADLYSLAVLLYRLATRAFPYEGVSIQELASTAGARGAVEWPEGCSEATWARLKEILDTGLASDPNHRWPTARAFAKALHDAGRQARREKGIPAWSDPSTRPATAPLPRPRNAFVGRHDLLRELGERLLQHGSLTTLVGPGGSGKTRLGVEAVRNWADTESPVWFVDLVPVQAERDVVPRIRKVLGLASESDETAFLEERTRETAGLLLLDNAEHVLGGVKDWLTAIYPRARNLSVVVTSREPVGAADEVVLLVPPMKLPGPGSEWGVSIQSEAVQLFLDRCRELGYSLEESSVAVDLIPEVCRKVDGLPLGLEIAASQLAGVPPGSWTQELRKGADAWVLQRAASDRHRTLRDVVEWVLPLLSPDAQEVFAASAVFSGGWTEEAAVEVLGRGLEKEPESIATALRELWRKSLIHLGPDPRGDLRYSMLETVRSAADDAFVRIARRDSLKALHFGYYGRLFIETPPEDAASPSRGEIWAGEEFNIAGALDHALERPDLLEEGAALAAALTEVWSSYAEFDVSDRYTKVFLDALQVGSPHRPMLSLHRAGIFWKRGEQKIAEELIFSAMEEGRSLQAGTDASITHAARVAEVRARTVAGLLYQSCFRLDDAHEVLDPAVSLAEEVGDEIGLARALYALAWTQINGDQLTEATNLLLRSLEIGRRCGDLRQQARALSGLGMVAWSSKRAEEAISYNSEAYEILRSLPKLDGAGEANILLGLGSAHVLKRDFPTAIEIFSRARDAALASGFAPLYASAVQSEANIQRLTGNYEEAARLFRRALEMQIRYGATRLVARCRTGVATSLAMCRRFEEAELEMHASFDEWFREETPAESTVSLYALGVLDREQDALEAAVTWFAAADKLGVPGDESCRDDLEQIRARLDENRYEEAVRLGTTLTFAQIQERIAARFSSPR